MLGANLESLFVETSEEFPVEISNKNNGKLSSNEILQICYGRISRRVSKAIPGRISKKYKGKFVKPSMQDILKFFKNMWRNHNWNCCLIPEGISIAMLEKYPK